MVNKMSEQKLDKVLESFDPKNNVELKRIYRCPECDAIILKKVEFNTLHRCSCGAFTHNKNFVIEFVAKY